MPASTAALLEALRSSALPLLLVVDENLQSSALPTAQQGQFVLTNRYDQHLQLQQLGWPSEFSDYRWPEALKHCASILYRISKEKAVVHHLINLAQQHLPPGGQLILIGHRGEGIKTYAKKAQQCLGGSRTERKLGGDLWRIELSRGATPGALLDTQDYHQLRAVAQLQGKEYLSKPGVFGWNKIDAGSTLLIEQLGQHSQLPLNSTRVLDLGCGSGHLILASCASDCPVTATDNNAAAILTTRCNLDNFGFSQAEVIASDAGLQLQPEFDLILCNPPFHSGFGINHDLTEKFSVQSARLLAKTGEAWFVVNQHVPLARIAARYFAEVELRIDNGHFCVYTLRKPKHC